MYMVNTMTVAAVSIACMVAISPRLTFYSLLPLPLVSLTVWFFGDRIHRRFERVQAQFADISARVQENLSGVRVVRAFTREAAEVETFGGMNREYVDRSQRLIQVWGVFHPLLGFLSGLAALLALYLGGREVVRGHISLGSFVAFTVYLAMLNWPVVALGWVINLFQRGMASFRRIADVMDVEPAIRSVPDAHRPAEAQARGGEIEFRGLTFTYPGADRPAIRDLSLRIEAGRTVALVGRTGAGKTSLLHLVGGLYTPWDGSVHVMGIDPRAIDDDRRRHLIGTVPQAVRLWHLGVDDCRFVLDALVDAGFLQWTPRWTIMRRGREWREEWSMEAQHISVRAVSRRNKTVGS